MIPADVVTLIDVTYTEDAIGQRVPTETYTEIFAEIRSVTQNEWFNAGKIGLKPSFTVVTPFMNYDGQKELLYKGRRYTIYRSFLREAVDTVELYCEEKVGS